MGYYTRFQLKVINGDKSVNYEESITESTSGCFEDECKWYDFEEQMKAYSLLHPEVTFRIYGEGEESGDVWRAWFKNGKMFRTYAEFVFEEYSEEKLT